MEHDDVLEDLLSWSGEGSGTAAKASPRRPSSSLQESCVNTSSSSPCRGRLPNSSPTRDEGGGDETVNHTPQKAFHCNENNGKEVGQPLQDKYLPLKSTSITSEVSSKDAFRLPDSVQLRLFPHQREGVQWLYKRHCKSRACLLADEMGLGKTVQVAAFLGELYRRKLIKTTVLIVPSTLVPMWTAALTDWGGEEIKKLVEVVHNDQRKRRQARWRKLKYGLPCVLLTTYGVLRQDAADMSATLLDYAVLDEAHLIKDANTCVFKSALMLSARHKIALSGTPLMNSFDDMWSVFRFLDGSILSLSKADFGAVSATLRRGNEKDASFGQRAVASAELNKLRAAIRPFMLRREKKDLADAVTSAKRDVVVWVRLSDVQQQQYEAFLESKNVATTSSLDSGAASNDQSTNPLLLLTMLSQICNHPWLNLVDTAFTTAVADPFTAPLPEMGDIFAGSKLWVALQLVVRCVRQGRKSLVFSRSKRLLRLVSCLLNEWCVPHAQVDGETSSDQRFAEVQRFNNNSDVWVCLLTTQVGGTGLTFTAASAVVLLDPSWNPSADAQAVDRVHRIGQASDVVIFRLVTCGTVEEKVYRNQIFKRMAALQSMRMGVLDEEELEEGGEGDVRKVETTSCSPQQEQTLTELHRYFTRLQLRSMFVMDDVDRSSTAEQLEVLHPHHVDDDLRRDLSRIEGVCTVSDNSCVLAERVDMEEMDGLPTSASASQADMMAEKAVCVPRSPPCTLPSSPAIAAVEGHLLGSATQRLRVEDAVGNHCNDFTSDDIIGGVRSDVFETTSCRVRAYTTTYGVAEKTERDDTLAPSSSTSSLAVTQVNSFPCLFNAHSTIYPDFSQAQSSSPACSVESTTTANAVTAVAEACNELFPSADGWKASYLNDEATDFGSFPETCGDGAAVDDASFESYSPLSFPVRASGKEIDAAVVSLPGCSRGELLLKTAREEEEIEEEEMSRVSSAEFASCRSSF